MDDHPGIVFRGGPMGPRTGVAAGPDVWEIVGALEGLRKRGQRAVKQLAEVLELGEEQIRVALDCYGELPDEIDELIRRNQEEAERAKRIWRRQQAALG